MEDNLDAIHSLVEQEKSFLPRTIPLWYDVFRMRPRLLGSTYLIWRYLANVFHQHGYTLYAPRNIEHTNNFEGMIYPPGFMESAAHEDEYGGVGLRFVQPPYRPTAYTWAAINRTGQDFVVKVVSDGQDAQGINELKILKYLSREDLRTDPRNHAIPVVEYIEHEQYVFAIFPKWTPFPRDDIRLPSTAIECCLQITEVLSFLHEKGVAHMGISPHNIVINYTGHMIPDLTPIGEHLPVKYYLIDFGQSILLDDSSGPLVSPLQLAPHRTSAPEVDSGHPFDPLAADVYQSAVFMLEHFYDLTGFTSEFLPVLQAMTSSPDERISITETHSRLLALRDRWNRDPSPFLSDSTGQTRNKYYETYLNVYRPLPGSLAMPKDDREAQLLRARMREMHDNSTISLADFNSPPMSYLLQVDPIAGTFGRAHAYQGALCEDSVGE
ncbi:hypothetical protein K523DRAFT_288636 [Schizophyllum commune Tattone D]|nr:hypothetical protein K523DRAFT_288636 [Schizophyllum commune Tattone D]